MTIKRQKKNDRFCFKYSISSHLQYIAKKKSRRIENCDSLKQFTYFSSGPVWKWQRAELNTFYPFRFHRPPFLIKHFLWTTNEYFRSNKTSGILWQMGLLCILILLIRFTMYCKARDLTMIALAINTGLKIHSRSIHNCIYNIKKVFITAQ